MKKTFTFSLILSLIFLRSFSYNGGPDTWGYTWRDSNEPNGPVYNWIDIIGGETAVEVKLLQDDNIRGPFSMNFDFHYYWYDVSQFYVGSNGYISFQNGNLASPFPYFPTTTSPNDVIGPFVNDLTFAPPGDSGKCYYWINPAHDTLIVSYIHVPFFETAVNGGFTGSNTFQIILSAVDSSITFQYQEQQGFSPYSGTSVVGIENNSGNIGLTWNNVVFTGNPQAGYAIKFYHPTNPTLTVKDVTTIYNDNPGTGAIFLPSNGGAHHLSTEVKNWGNVKVPQFNVHGFVKDDNNNTLVTDDHTTVDSLDVYESETFIFNNALFPGASGTYRYATSTQLAGDDIPIDNSQLQEIVVVDTTQPEIRLGYDAGQNTNLASINWIGGNGGIGCYFIPPIYPCHITKLYYWILSNSGSGMSCRVFDDDGISGLPFTLYDSIYLDASVINIGGWTTVELPNPITITSGGFYVSWDMQGEFISLACATNMPFSNRSYEVFLNGWGIFRYHDIEDPLINVSIESGFPTDIPSPAESNLQMQLYPNPASDQVMIQYAADTKQKVWLVVTDLQGKMLNRWDLGTGNGTAGQTFSFDAKKYTPGMYLVELYSGKVKKMDKLIISR